MYIDRIIWLHGFVEKLEAKHGVSTEEVEEILHGRMKVRRVGRGDVQGEDLYLALGQNAPGTIFSSVFPLQTEPRCPAH